MWINWNCSTRIKVDQAICRNETWLTFLSFSLVSPPDSPKNGPVHACQLSPAGINTRLLSIFPRSWDVAEPMLLDNTMRWHLSSLYTLSNLPKFGQTWLVYLIHHLTARCPDCFDHDDHDDPQLKVSRSAHFEFVWLHRYPNSHPASFSVFFLIASSSVCTWCS